MNNVPTKLAEAEQLEYTVLAPLPGTLRQDGKTADLQSYIPGVFKLVIGLAAVIAVAYIIFGGFQYITTDAIQGKQEGKKRIQNAIYGLIMVSISWLILYTINPNLLTFDLNIGAIQAPENRFANAPGTVYGNLSANEAFVRFFLQENSIGVNNDPCPAGQTTGCTNVAGLSENALNGLATLSATCNCNMTVTGGTEDGHETHGIGLGKVDLRFDPGLDTYITSNAIGSPRQTSLGLVYTVTIRGQQTEFLKESDHWHVSFP